MPSQARISGGRGQASGSGRWRGANSALLCLATALSCSAEQPASPTAGQGTAPQRLKIPATTTDLDAFDATASGGAGRAGPKIALEHGLGTWVDAGQVLALHLHYGLHFAGYEIAGGYAVAPQRLTAVWLYCRDGALTHLWQLDTAGGAIQGHKASGSCQVSHLPVHRPVHLRALDLPAPKVAAGFKVTGPEIHLGPARVDGTSGTLRWRGQWLPAWVYARVACGNCGKVGWDELHLLGYQADPPQIISAIAYLFANTPDRVQVARVVQWPQLAPAASMALAATWSVEP